MQINEMPMMRIFFAKTGRVKYTSHLDLMRMLTRALRRSKLPLWYTQGFHPHLYMTFALPIALGSESKCESMDLRFTQWVAPEEIVAALNAVFPPGILAWQAAAPQRDPGQIAWADYEIRLLRKAPEEILEKLHLFLQESPILVHKKTKKGEKQMDIRPHISLLHAEVEDTGLQLGLRTAAGNTLNIAPGLFLKAFDQHVGIAPDRVQICRKAILCGDFEKFQ